MSIIDNDSTSSTRNNPTLNVNDDGGVRKAHNTYGNTLRRVGSAVKQFLSFGQGTIEAKDADGNKSFFLGYDPALSTRPVIRVAKDGFDAQTGADSELVFNSEQNTVKVVSSGTLKLTAVAGTSVAKALDISSLGLSGPPLIISAAVSPASAVAYYSMPIIQNPGTTSEVIATSWVNFIAGSTQEVRFQVQLGAVAAGYAGVWSFKYYILQESAD